MERILRGPAEGREVVEIKNIKPGADVFPLGVGGFLVAVQSFPLLDRRGGAAVHKFGPGFNLLSASTMLLIFFNPSEDFAITQTAGDLFFQGDGIHSHKFQEILIQRAVVVVFAVFFAKSGTTLVENPGKKDIATESDARATRRMLG
jgi:hypothetical protein